MKGKQEMWCHEGTSTFLLIRFVCLSRESPMNLFLPTCRVRLLISPSRWFENTRVNSLSVCCLRYASSSSITWLCASSRWDGYVLLRRGSRVPIAARTPQCISLQRRRYLPLQCREHYRSRHHASQQHSSRQSRKRFRTKRPWSIFVSLAGGFSCSHEVRFSHHRGIVPSQVEIDALGFAERGSRTQKPLARTETSHRVLW